VAVQRKLLLDKYERRLLLIWKSLLSGPRKARATNSLCVPVIIFGLGIIPWTKQEIQHFYVLTRRVMTTTCNHHARSAVECLYLPQSEGCCGLINVENLFHRQLVVLSHHLFSSNDVLVQLCNQLDSLLPPCLSVAARADVYFASLCVDADWRSWSSSTIKKELCKHEICRMMDTLIAKPLHGKFQSLLTFDGIDVGRSMCWLRQHLHSESESTLCAIQDQVIAT